jgi:hypothetical protein
VFSIVPSILVFWQKIKTELKQYFSVLEFRRIRNLVVPKAEKEGIFTEGDVYKRVS